LRTHNCALSDVIVEPSQIATNEGDRDTEEESEEEEEEEEENDEPQADEPHQSLKGFEQPSSTLPTVTSPAEGGKTSRLRKRRVLEVDEENLCADDGCEKTIEEVDLLRCNAPGCGLTVS